MARWIRCLAMVSISLALIGCQALELAATPPGDQIEATPHPASTSSATPTYTTAAPKHTPTVSGPLKITIVYDNNAYDERLETAWGFACLVEGLEHTILFDTGGDGELLLRNMDALGMDPSIIDTVVLSHIHGDHVGGLPAFLERNPNVTVYLPTSFPSNFQSQVRDAGARIVATEGPAMICAGAHSTGELGKAIREQALVLESPKGLVVITGCAHPGVVNVLQAAKAQHRQDVALVMGGFHLSSAAQPQIAQIVKSLQDEGVARVAPCHCSGDLARQVFADAYGDRYVEAGVGCRIVIER